VAIAASSWLRDLGLVKFAQHEKKLWLRRGWYTIDYQVLKASQMLMCECEHSRVSETNL